MTWLLEMKNITKTFGAVKAVDNVSLRLNAGEVVSLCGENGSGKSTLMKVLCGLFPPDSGRVEVNGVDIRQLGINNYHKMIACVMQDDKLW